MSATAEGIGQRQGSDSRERDFYRLMALVFAAVAVVGFAPNSIAILAGTRENPPLLIHVHAAAMSAWVLLLATQATLVATGRRALHQRLGMVSLVLAPLIVLLMLIIALPVLLDPFEFPAIAMVQFKRITVFAGCVALALYWRLKRPDYHKRLMFLATFAVLDAAFFRMEWFLPAFGIDNAVILGHLYQYVLLIPLLAFDVLTTGRIHPAYLVVIPFIIVSQTAAALLW